MDNVSGLVDELKQQFGDSVFTQQSATDETLTLWVQKIRIVEVLSYLKQDIEEPFEMLFDLAAIDERTRGRKNGTPFGDFSLVYHLFSFQRNAFIRLKVALQGDFPSALSVDHLWKNANWYEREV
ncbi:MAG TPA: NADH-quinone oxidoreductase subunit C, partial [Sphingobacteriaceae bacterium]